MDTIIDFGRTLLATISDPNERISALYILCTVGLAFVLWRASGRGKSFRQWLLPRDVYTHRSNLLDIKLFITNKFLGFVGVTGAVFFPPLVAYAVLEMLSGAPVATPEGAATWTVSLIATVIIVMTSDFCKYWAHRWHHELRALWPFHAVHHSADVMTPLTVMRSHPVETMIRNLLISAILGAVQGVMLFAVVGRIDIVTLGGANALYFLFNALGANLRHSHIWLSYGPVLSRIFISPAQHQIHHSRALEHHNRNYGSMFALWDWAFGTLYVPTRREALTFGLADADGTPIPQPYTTLAAALFGPFRESWAALRGAPKARPDTETATETAPQ